MSGKMQGISLFTAAGDTSQAIADKNATVLQQAAAFAELVALLQPLVEDNPNLLATTKMFGVGSVTLAFMADYAAYQAATTPAQTLSAELGLIADGFATVAILQPETAEAAIPVS
jgi:hypothetical protein